MTALEHLVRADDAALTLLGLNELSTESRAAKFDNRPTWDNGKKFDNRPTWDNWSKK